MRKFWKWRHDFMVNNPIKTAYIGFSAVYEKDSYRGSCKTEITETWTEDPPTGVSSVDGQMNPTPIVYITPLFKCTIGSCLHGSITISGTTGTGSEEWEFLTFNKTFPATNQTTWPATVVAKDESFQASNGWVRRKVTVTAPT